MTGATQPLVPFRGAHLVLRVTTPTVVKTEPGEVCWITVLTAGSELGGVFNADTLDGAIADHQVSVIPNAVGSYRIGWPCNLGIVVVPGEGMAVLVIFK